MQTYQGGATITDADSIFTNQITTDTSAFGISDINIFGFSPTFPSLTVRFSSTPGPGAIVLNLFTNSTGVINRVAAPVPAPSAMTLLGFGLVGLGVMRQRRKQRLA
jgi:hypothetical protein